MRTLAIALALATASTAAAQSGPPLLVVGGQQAPEGAWPEVAGLMLEGVQVSCTGTLIAPNLVLTADHCVDPQYIGSYKITDVLLDETDWWQSDQPKRPIAEIHRHPRADIAVLVLEDDVEGIEPRAVADGCVVDRYLEDDAPAAIVGYGLTNPNSQFNTKLMEGITSIVKADCSDSFSYGCNTSLEPGSELYAGGDGVDACSGDSGGPLFLLTELGDYLVGVTSRGPEGCRHGAIWVRPDAFMDWIEEETGQDIPLVTCNEPPTLGEGYLTVPQGKTRRTELAANDPEGDADFTWALAEAPAHGTVEIDDKGRISYTADDDYVGEDSFLIEVTDTSGFPLQSAVSRVGVDVTEGGFLGCSSTGAPLGAAWLVGLSGLLVAGRRRRDA